MSDTAVTAALQVAERSIQDILDLADAERTFDNTLGAIDDLLVRLRVATELDPLLLAYVSPHAEDRERANQAEQALRDWGSEFRQREDLYRAVRSYADRQPDLDAVRARYLEETLRDYRRAGMDLDPAGRAELLDLDKELNRLSLEFQKAIRDDETMVAFTRDELAGLDEDFLGGLTRQGDLYLCGMEYPTLLPILDRCTVESTRQKLHLAHKRRGGRRNVAVLEQILVLRDRQARLLGYAHTADYRTETRMAKAARPVQEFYERLRPVVRRKSLRDHQELTEAKRAHTGDAEAVLQPWDQAFYKEHLLRTRHAVDPQAVREYLSLDPVLEGLFGVTRSLYGLRFEEVTDQAEARSHRLWHEEVRLFDVHDQDQEEPLGSVFLDLHPRPNKYGHAAQFGLHPRKRWPDGTLQKPLVALVCNFTRPTAERPSLLSMDEVVTLFHEFGHCLHSLLTEVDLGAYSGTSVARDFVEVPSQMFENWVWDAQVLKTFARHYRTGEPFPEELLQGLLAARHVASGLEAERQLYYGLVDLTYHTAEGGKVDTTKVAQDLVREVELYEPVPETWFQASFGHLMGYEAGYYGYLWSLVFAADMFRHFRQQGVLSADEGRHFRKAILAPGGTVDAMDLIQGYLGREPDLEAFLLHLGLDPTGEE